MDHGNHVNQSDIDILVKSGIIDPEQLRKQAEENRRKVLIESYKYKIYFSCGLWYVKMPDGKRIRRKNRKDIEDIVIRVQQEYGDMLNTELPNAKEIFAAWQKKRLACRLAVGATVLRDKYTFSQYLEGKDISKKPISFTTRKEWTQFLQTILNEQKPTAKDFARLKGVVKNILHEAEDREYILYTAEEVIDRVRVYKKSFTPAQKKSEKDEVYLPNELRKLKTYCLEHENPYTRCILMSIITGARPGEICCCRQEDLDAEKGVLTIGRTETRSDENGHAKEAIREGTKTEAGTRKVVIPECDRAWAEKIKQIAQCYSREWLFPQEPDRFEMRYTGNRIRSQQLRRRMKDICTEIGIPYKSPHKFRKTYASILRASGTSDEVIISQMGHTDIGTTERYYIKDRTEDELKAAALSEIAELRIEH